VEEAKKEIEKLLISKPDIIVFTKAYIASFILDENLVDNIIVGLEKTGLVIQTNVASQIPT
jgi:hypothetical protein